MYSITIIECAPNRVSKQPYADVRLSDDLHDRMPPNGSVRAYPHSHVCREHRVRRTTDRTFAFTMDNIGENTCAIVLEEVSYLTGISMMRIDVRIDRCGAPATTVLKLAQAIRATQTKLGNRPRLVHDERPPTVAHTAHITK